MAKYLISVCKNNVTGSLDVVEGAVIKGLNAVTYEVNDDFDFGAIEPVDVAVSMYTGGDPHPAITVKEF